MLTRRSRASTFQIVSAQLTKNNTRITFVLDTHFDLMSLMGQKVAAFGVGFCAGSLLSCQKLHWFPFEHWLVSFQW